MMYIIPTISITAVFFTFAICELQEKTETLLKKLELFLNWLLQIEAFLWIYMVLKTVQFK